jgi:DNA-binding response OmpR family regulator
VQVRSRPSVLAVTEEIAFGHSLKWLLHDHDFVVNVTDGYSALSQTSASKASAILVDVAPSVAYVGEIIRQLRSRVGSAPIIALGNDETSYEIEYLQHAGADEHLAPSERAQLALRIRQRLRFLSDASLGVRLLTIELDEYAMTARIRGRAVTLTAIECALLARLLRQPNCIVTASELLRDVPWQRANVGPPELRSSVRLLRRKIEDDPRHPRRLLTVVDNGYIFRPDA